MTSDEITSKGQCNRMTQDWSPKGNQVSFSVEKVPPLLSKKHSSIHLYLLVDKITNHISDGFLIIKVKKSLKGTGKKSYPLCILILFTLLVEIKFFCKLLLHPLHSEVLLKTYSHSCVH